MRERAIQNTRFAIDLISTGNLQFIGINTHSESLAWCGNADEKISGNLGEILSYVRSDIFTLLEGKLIPHDLVELCEL